MIEKEQKNKMQETTLYYKIIKEVFKDRADALIKKLNEPFHRSFIINALKASYTDLKDLLDFEAYPTSEEMVYDFDIDDIGKRKAYILGLLYPQERSAIMTHKLIKDHPAKLIVDLCAAPGGKTIDLAIKYKDEALIIANEVDKKRAQALLSNIERLGISNIIITTKDVDRLALELSGLADIVVSDAPCSGMGMARKYPSIVNDLSEKDIKMNVIRQKKILDAAYRLLKKDGLLLYSTCTYTYEENDGQIIELLKRHPFKIIDKKLFSFLDDTEGQFMCLLSKLDETDMTKPSFLKECKDKKVIQAIKKIVDISSLYLYELDGSIYLSKVPLYDLDRAVLRYGVKAGEMKGDIFYPAHSLFRSNMMRERFFSVIDLDDIEYRKYIQGYEIKKDVSNGFHLVTHLGYALGYIKATNGTLKNKYPKGLRVTSL